MRPNCANQQASVKRPFLTEEAPHLAPGQIKPNVRFRANALVFQTTAMGAQKRMSGIRGQSGQAMVELDAHISKR